MTLARLMMTGLMTAVSMLTAATAEEGARTNVALPDGGTISLYSEETGAGPPVVLLHGLGESTFTWRKIVPALAEAHRVIALDLKGFGRSDKPRDGDYSADDQAAVVARFLQQRELAGVTLVGHSFGGTVALRTALVSEVKEARGIARLVIIAAPALPGSVAADLTLADVPAVPDAVTFAVPPKALSRLLLSAARGGGEVSDADVDGYAAPYFELAAKHAFVVTARSILSETGNDVAQRYRTIRLPVLLVWCRGDSIVPLRSGKKLARTLPNGRLSVLERCHHLPQDERPDALLSAIRPFLEH